MLILCTLLKTTLEEKILFAGQQIEFGGPGAKRYPSTYDIILLSCTYCK